MAELRVAEDARAATWLTSRIQGFAKSVCSVVPSGFAAYVRVFHPAEWHSDPGAEPVSVRWEAIEVATGKLAHPAMQLEALTGLDQYRQELPGVFNSPPAIGCLLTGPVESASHHIFDGDEQSANLWWPDDEGWCVATEIDLNTSYIACSEPCRDDILSATELEAAARRRITGHVRARAIPTLTTYDRSGRVIAFWQN